MYFIKEHGELSRKRKKKKKKQTKLSPKIFKTKNGRLIMQPKFDDCGIAKSRFVKEQEAKYFIFHC